MNDLTSTLADSPGPAMAHWPLPAGALADALPDLLWVVASDGSPRYLNRRFQQFTGLTLQTAHGDAMAALIHPGDREQITQRWRQALRSGEGFWAQCRLRRVADGAYLRHLLRAVPYHDLAQNTVFWIGTCTDIEHLTLESDRQRRGQEQALGESQQRLVMAMDAGRMGSWEWILATGTMTWSAGLERMHGLEPNSFGSTLSDFLALVHPDDRQRVQQELETTVSLRRDYVVEYRVALADGSVRWVEARGIVFSDSLSQPQRVAGVCLDVTERKAAEQSLKEYSEELERRVEQRTTALRDLNSRLEISNRELQDFASVASHDLQEPLRKIQAFGDRLVIKSGPALGPEGQDYLNRMKNAAGRMQTLISDLLSFSRITTRAQPFVDVDLNEIVRDVLSDLETAIEQAAARVEIEDLPHIDADPMQMRQLWQNLIGNALKFRKAGAPTIVRVYCRRLETADSEKPELQIFVSDNGIGFDEKYLDRIFNVFQRLHGRSAYEGTGIGLAVCRKIAERHGGSITAASRPDEGATFVVTLPQRQSNPQPIQTEGV